jgi:hypothetical protein
MVELDEYQRVLTVATQLVSLMEQEQRCSLPDDLSILPVFSEVPVNLLFSV